MYVYMNHMIQTVSRDSPIECQSGAYQCPVRPMLGIAHLLSRAVDVSVLATLYSRVTPHTTCFFGFVDAINFIKEKRRQGSVRARGIAEKKAIRWPRKRQVDGNKETQRRIDRQIKTGTKSAREEDTPHRDGKERGKGGEADCFVRCACFGINRQHRSRPEQQTARGSPFSQHENVIPPAASGKNTIPRIFTMASICCRSIRATKRQREKDKKKRKKASRVDVDTYSLLFSIARDKGH